MCTCLTCISIQHKLNKVDKKVKCRNIFVIQVLSSSSKQWNKNEKLMIKLSYNI